MSQIKHPQSPKRWRSLAELEESADFQEFVHREFPTAASELPDGISRRRWLQLMGASFALATVAGCRWKAEEFAPFADRPDGRIPGEPQKFATVVDAGGAVRPLVVTCIDGRPIKVEGNPEHPDSEGATDAKSQALVLDLYDPDRSAALIERVGRKRFSRDWDDFAKWSADTFQGHDGSGVGILVEAGSSPSRYQLLQRLLKKMPQAGIYRHNLLPQDSIALGAELATGEPLVPIYALDKAKVIVCLDDDLLGHHPTAVRNIREYAQGREPKGGHMSRLYAVESQFTATGAAADHRLAIRSSDIADFCLQLEQELDRRDSGQLLSSAPAETRRERFVAAIADDLLAHQGESLLSCGPRQPAELHAHVLRLNERLGNVHRTVRLRRPPVDESAVTTGTLAALESKVRAGDIDTLLILGGNPVYTSPGDCDFAELLDAVPQSVHLSRYRDETSRRCKWHLPEAHPFEAWDDARSADGIYSVAQPLIAPLLNGKSSIEVLSIVLGAAEGSQDDARDIVRETYTKLAGGDVAEQTWRRFIHDGFDLTTRYPEAEEVAWLESKGALPRSARAAETIDFDGEALEVVFTASDMTYDGSFANNGWLQETPDFATKLTWDNAALISPGTAAQLNVKQGELVDLTVGGASIRVPIFLLPGQADGSVALALGYGRTAAGMVGGDVDNNVRPVGVDAGPLRKSDSLHVALNATLTGTGEVFELATTQDHHAIDETGLKEIAGRVGELVREGTLQQFSETPKFAQQTGHHDAEHESTDDAHHSDGEESSHDENLSLWEEPSYDGHAWGMSIDLNKCVGCNACMVACQSENNVPIVGKDQVLIGREMHWIRTDRYFVGEVDDPQMVNQPVACHHCENAPCEQVCPVAATVHSDEGLNDMIYNRCVGTRYCANNCPYKVRRFNFFDYNDQLHQGNNELIQLGVNPEVTVRSRGVMEKCTYCVQRIQHVKIGAKNDARPIEDGEIVTACQQACPAQAIEFGDLNDPKSRVSEAHANPRAYGMLAELNVKPRTKYLARLRNPHPLLDSSTAEHSADSEDHHG